MKAFSGSGGLAVAFVRRCPLSRNDRDVDEAADGGDLTPGVRIVDTFRAGASVYGVTAAEHVFVHLTRRLLRSPDDRAHRPSQAENALRNARLC